MVFYKLIICGFAIIVRNGKNDVLHISQKLFFNNLTHLGLELRELMRTEAVYKRALNTTQGTTASFAIIVSVGVELYHCSVLLLSSWSCSISTESKSSIYGIQELLNVHLYHVM